MSRNVVVPAPRVTWRILPPRTPHVVRACPRCGGPRPFASSDRFRVNASGRKLDVWLIYRCAACDFTWNLTVVERATPEEIGAARLAAYRCARLKRAGLAGRRTSRVAFSTGSTGGAPVPADAGHPDGGRSPRGGVAQGSLSALLQELAKAPDEELGGAWDSTLRPDAVVGRFELVRELGRGGFGVVWEATDREHGRRVALKAVRAGARARLREERLLLEAESAARLSHPNIVALYEVGRAPQGAYLVMELLRGRSLADRLALGRLPIPEALRIAVGVARGVAHAHAQGVVHRDLKPENIFLCDDGGLKVLDFGLAHAFGQRRLDGGTTGYMAPEQAEGAPEDERTDVFALGVVLHEALSGERPFASEKALRSKRAAPALDVPGEPALGGLLSRMLAKRPVERPRDGGEVLAALTAFELSLSAASSAVRVRTRRGPRLRLSVLLAIVLGVAAAVGGGVVEWRTAQGGSPGTSAPGLATPALSIAVLPFVDASPDHDSEFFAEGVAEEILNALAQVEGLRVIGRGSSFSFRGKADGIAEIGKKLDVATVLVGTVRKAGNDLGITARLVGASDETTLWSQSFDGRLDDVFGAQEEVARGVVRALNVRLHGDRPSTREIRPRSVQAYEQLLVGRSLYAQGTVPALRGAVGALEAAVAIDPTYAHALAWLSVSLAMLEAFERPTADLARRKRALDLADEAVGLAPGLAEAHWARGLNRLMYAWDWAGAGADLERALALQPGSGSALAIHALLLAALGRLPEAVREGRRACEVEPLTPNAWAILASFQNAGGEWARAREAADRGLQLAPRHFLALRELGLALLLEHRPQEALARFEHHPSRYMRLTGIAIALHDLGRHEEAQRALRALAEEASGAYSYQLAQVHAWTGDLDAAFASLERSYATRKGGCRFVKYDPFLRGLRGDPRYPAFLRKMGLPVD